MRAARAAAVMLLVLVAASVADAATPSIEDLFRKSQYSGGALSPSGRHLAVIAPVGEHLGVAVIVFGGSYGGYAAMWGAIKQEKSIRCAISLAGVTKIDYMFDNAQTDMAQFVEKSSLAAELIGDPKTDRERFRRVSPLDHADEVGVPILLAYGTSDRRVPLVHGSDFRAALDKHGKAFEYVTYPDEGHGLNRDENVFDFFRRVEAFAAQHLGAAPR